jgi:hypothetical protein
VETVVLDSVQFDELVALLEDCKWLLQVIAIAVCFTHGQGIWRNFMRSKKEENFL